MRLFTKIFLCGMLVFSVAFSFSGYFLLHYSMESSLAREVDFALRQYQYDKFTVQSAGLTYLDFSLILDSGVEQIFPHGDQNIEIWKVLPGRSLVDEGSCQKESGEVLLEGESSLPGGDILLEEGDAIPGYEDVFWDGQQEETFRTLASEFDVPVGFFGEDKSLIYSELEGFDPSFLEDLSEDAHVYQFLDSPQGGSILVGSLVQWENSVTFQWKGAGTSTDGDSWVEKSSGGDSLSGDYVVQDTSADSYSQEDLFSRSGRIYFVTQWDVSKTMRQQDTMRQYFTRCYLVALGAGMVLLGILSALLTGPLKRMSKAARRMAEGCYEERLPRGGRDEIGVLAESFNQMAAAVEGKIGELSQAAQEKEDFVANFAHELKTPLTSIIGYADTIYQKELSREENRRASWHIWNEGMRLEALSLKLMELTVLHRQEFPLQELPGEELLADVAESLSPIFQDKGIEFHLRTEQAYVMADFDLLKTLLINLVDNSIKAGAGRIELGGRKEEIRQKGYLVWVEDDGCGMEEEALSRITEAFYMVDKARSRKQHGAGLGLALGERIAAIHGSRLQFESRKGHGTRVSFYLKMDPQLCRDSQEQPQKNRAAVAVEPEGERNE